MITYAPCGLVYRSVGNTELLNENIEMLNAVLRRAKANGRRIVVADKSLYGDRQVRELELMLDTLKLPYDQIYSVEQTRVAFEEARSVDFNDNITFLSSQMHYPLQAFMTCPSISLDATEIFCITPDEDKIVLNNGKIKASTTPLRPLYAVERYAVWD